MSAPNTREFHMRVAAEIRAEMARQHKLQRELGAALGLSQPQVGKRLRGTIPFDVAELDRVAEFLGVDLSSFLERAA